MMEGVRNKKNKRCKVSDVKSLRGLVFHLFIKNSPRFASWGEMREFFELEKEILFLKAETLCYYWELYLDESMPLKIFSNAIQRYTYRYWKNKGYRKIRENLENGKSRSQWHI